MDEAALQTALAAIPAGTAFVDAEFPLAGGRARRVPRDLPLVATSADAAASATQGASLGDCWLLSGAILLRTRAPERLRALFAHSRPADGLYVVRLTGWDGAPRFVVIDDQVPVASGKWVHARSDTETWPFLLEKAAAKLHGGYAHLAGGSIAEGLALVTASPVDDINLERDDMTAAAVFKLLCRRHAAGDLLACGRCVSGVAAETASQSGLLVNHAYVIHDTRVKDGKQWLCLGNPWGPRSKWGALAKGKGDRVWVLVQDWARFFNRVYVCTLLDPASTTTVALRGAWTAPTAGGSSQNSTFRTNPVYRVRPGASPVHVTLALPDRREEARAAGKAISYPAIGLTLFGKTGAATDATPVALLSRGMIEIDPGEVSSFWNAQQVSRAVAAGRPMLVAASTFAPGVLSEFSIIFRSAAPFEADCVSTEELGAAASQTGAWSGKSAAGGPKNPGFTSNPQYQVQASVPTRATVFVRQKAVKGKPLLGIGMYLAPRRIVDWPVSPSAFLQPAQPFSNQREVAVEVDLGDTPIVVIPCTFKPRQEASFAIEVVPWTKTATVEISSVGRAAPAKATTSAKAPPAKAPPAKATTTKTSASKAPSSKATATKTSSSKAPSSKATTTTKTRAKSPTSKISSKPTNAIASLYAGLE